MMAAFLDVAPREPVVDRASAVTSRWLKWLMTLREALNAAPQREIPTVALASQSGSVATTTLPAAPLKAGFYRVSVFVSVSATVVLGFTLGGSASTVTLGPAAPLSATAFLQVDAESAITYAITATGTYDAGICLERVDA